MNLSTKQKQTGGCQKSEVGEEGVKQLKVVKRNNLLVIR